MFYGHISTLHDNYKDMQPIGLHNMEYIYVCVILAASHAAAVASSALTTVKGHQLYPLTCVRSAMMCEAPIYQ